ncbi:NAD-dependent epimerase/dehydratase family protein [Phytohabitans suffuscus]|uniref:NAD-dependent epimerase/dehydratase domain-containing protein n=1 Tax=Phytohabitans suffuscus TaxID=624315 RepID=A0A6F8YQQ2_9ACTN|nr:NAD-dependent epimerase/dehydratase family protein [Phytohabitans suffuscus]BCB88515.1 hypothetical protein Psuf_058280 [Phytohabitans suffuscus]
MPTPPDRRPLVVVLGATGTIGSVVAASLAARPVRLRLVGRQPAPPPPGARAAVEVRAADLTDPDQLRSTVDGAGAVVHLLADPRAGDLNARVMAGVLDTLSARSDRSAPPAVLYAGTVTQVGVPPRALLDGTETDRPDTAFQRDKHTAERALLRASAQGAVRGVSVRLPTVYGHSHANGRLDSGALTAMIRRAVAGDPLTMWHDGTVRRDLLHVRDAAAALLAALDHAGALAGRHWLAGTGTGTPLGDAFRTVAHIVATRTGRPPVPVGSVPPPRPLSTAELTSTTVDPAAFHRHTGWTAQVPLHDGLEWTVTAALSPTPASRLGRVSKSVTAIR